MGRVYVSGPMRGRAHFNAPAFDAATELLRAEGHEVFCPREKDLKNGFDSVGLTGLEDLASLGFDVRSALAEDMDWICREATAVFMLPGWSDSKGATAERATALALGLEIWGALE
jgi:hypothetical protein